MNTRNLIVTALVALTASGAALAQIAAYPENYTGPEQVKSQVSRATVKAQVLTAQADGTLQIQPLNYPVQTALKSKLTRAEVTAELQDTRLDDAVIYGITSYPYQSGFVSQRSRADVRAETLTASAKGRASASQN